MWQKFFYEDFPWVRSILAWTTLCIYRIWKVRIKLVFCLLNNNSFFFSFSFFDWDAVDVSLLNLFESMYYLVIISVIVWHAAQQIKKTHLFCSCRMAHHKNQAFMSISIEQSFKMKAVGGHWHRYWLTDRQSITIGSKCRKRGGIPT